MTDRLDGVLARIDADAALWSDLEAVCALGGRFAGTDSEARARDFLAGRLHDACGAAPIAHCIDYEGWRRGEGALEIVDARGPVPCVPLVRSPPTPPGGLEAEVVDLGRGDAADFALRAAEIPGRITLVRHEYMFAADTVHRRRKYQWAMEAGAAGFLIAGHLPGELPVTGSSGAGPDGDGIPAAGLSAGTAARLAAAGGAYPRVRLRIEAKTGPASTANLIVDLPGHGPGWVVLCAHLDGHHLAESAMDNATGLAVALAVARALAPCCGRLARGLRLALFSIEEWALAGSARYVEELDRAERDAIGLVLNLDSVAGSPRLTALTSGFPAAECFLLAAASGAGMALGVHRPLIANSDHYNFAIHGIPAVRLVAGFDEPASNLRYVLTPADTLDKIAPAELRDAARLAATLALRACEAPALALR